MSIILDGRKTREALVPGLIAKIKRLSYVPHLVIIQVGNRPDSAAYIRGKQSFAQKIGVNQELVQFPDSILEQEIISAIQKYNADPLVQGIILQLPLPSGLDQNNIIEAIDYRKDVDGLTSPQVKGWLADYENAILPATARGVKEFLAHNAIPLLNKKVVVVGRSMLVGKPIAAMCLSEGATVTVCHSKTADLAAETKIADIIIVAAGKIGLINASHVREGQVVIDVGINTITGEKLEDEIEDRRLVGDVDFESVKDIVAATSPVPGGVGPMTVLGLFENLIDLCK